MDIGIKNVFNFAICKHYTTDYYHYQDQKAQMAQLPENGEFIGDLSNISTETLSDIEKHHRTLFFSDQRNCSNTKMKHFMFVLRFMVFYSSDVWLLVFCRFFGTFKLEETRFHFIFYSTWCLLSIVLLPVSIKGAKSPSLKLQWVLTSGLRGHTFGLRVSIACVVIF